VRGALGDLRVELRGSDGLRTAAAGAVVLVGSGELRRVAGIYRVDADASPAILEATAAKLGVLLGRTSIRTDGSSAVVREALCRACGTCEAACPFEAVEVRDAAGRRAAVVTAGRCEGCGLCVARCPSGAITLGVLSDGDIELSLQALCQGWRV
jgi:heterodisulfide reductase subunit A-like polyferredoxin